MRNYAVSSIDQNTLVLVDSRIYVGTYSWIFNDKNYVDASTFYNLFKAASEYPGQKYPIKTLFIECINDDCGWGTIKDQPELNASMENYISQFMKTGVKIRAIEGGGSITGVRGAEIEGEPFYNVYATTINLPYEVLEATKQTHAHFFYYIPRDRDYEKAFDHYSVNGFLDNALNLLAYVVLYAIVLAAFLSVGVPFYLLYKYKN